MQFGNKVTDVNGRETEKTPEEQIRDRASGSRNILYILGGISLANMILMAMEADTIVVISPSVPYLAVLISAAMGDVAPGFLIGLLISAIFPICGLLGKKNPTPMLVALIAMILDFLGMFGIMHAYEIPMTDMLMDIVAHVGIVIVLGIQWRAQVEVQKLDRQNRDSVNPYSY